MENVTVSNKQGDKLFEDDPFDVTFLGFNRSQVEEFIADTRNRVRALETQLTELSRGYEQARLSLNQATTRLDDANQQLASRAPHEEVGGRLMEILRLANEEADQTRSTALGEVDRMVQDAHSRAQAVLEAAQTQAEQLLAQAHQHADALVSGSQRESEQLLGRSRQESEELTSRSRQHAESLVGSAQARADQLLNDATGRAALIDHVQDKRLAIVAGAHVEVLSRLEQIQHVLGDVLSKEDAAGPVEALFGGPRAEQAEQESVAMIPEQVVVAVPEQSEPADVIDEPVIDEPGPVEPAGAEADSVEFEQSVAEQSVAEQSVAEESVAEDVAEAAPQDVVVGSADEEEGVEIEEPAAEAESIEEEVPVEAEAVVESDIDDTETGDETETETGAADEPGLPVDATVLLEQPGQTMVDVEPIRDEVIVHSGKEDEGAGKPSPASSGRSRRQS